MAKFAFVIQRCGREVNGGAETLCLKVAQRMARFWETTILTTCALDYMRWDNYYPQGEERIGDTCVQRFPVDQPRDVNVFNRLSEALRWRGDQAALDEQEHWMRAQGPISSKLLLYISDQISAYDAFIFFGYLYATTYFGLPLVKEKAFLAPLAHDEWPIHFKMWDRFFALPRGFVFQTEEERAFVQRRFPSLSIKGPVAGIGIDPRLNVQPKRLRKKYDLQGKFLLYVGRIDASKGCAEMFDYFLRSCIERDFSYKLVLIGKEVMPVPFNDRIISLGFVSEEEKWDAMAACDWLVLPSEFESLSIALLETWSVGRPAIVNGKSEVLVGHCRRANGGLWYRTWRECDAILDVIDDRTKMILGQQGHDYVKDRYNWARIEADYLRTVTQCPNPDNDGAAKGSERIPGSSA